MNGGYFADSWGWPTLVFLLLATGAAVVGERLVLRRLDVILLGGTGRVHRVDGPVGALGSVGGTRRGRSAARPALSHRRGGVSRRRARGARRRSRPACCPRRSSSRRGRSPSGSSRTGSARTIRPSAATCSPARSATRTRSGCSWRWRRSSRLGLVATSESRALRVAAGASLVLLLPDALLHVRARCRGSARARAVGRRCTRPSPAAVLRRADRDAAVAARRRLARVALGAR